MSGYGLKLGVTYWTYNLSLELNIKTKKKSPLKRSSRYKRDTHSTCRLPLQCLLKQSDCILIYFLFPLYTR